MAATWDHPKLGRFVYDSPGWTKIVDVPAFKAFSYDTGYRNAPRSKGKHRLVFGASDAGDLPTAAEVAVADQVLANHSALVRGVTEALWEDFNGRGPGSGMWWHGNLDAVGKSLTSRRKLPNPNGAQDLLPALQVSALLVRGGFPGHGAGPLVELSFRGAFDEEHGVSVLTDGRSILGIGPNLDVLPFDYKPAVPSRFG